MREARATLEDIIMWDEVSLGRGEIISIDEINATPGDYPVYSSSAKGTGEFGRYGKYMFDEELITWSVDGGGRPFYRPKHRFSVTNVCGYLRVQDRSKWNYRYLHAAMALQHARISFDYQMKAHPSVIKKLYTFIPLPLHLQQRIAEILSTVDKAIEHTEALIAKTQQIKAGLMHDLFTRGVTPDGQLRPPCEEAPQLYKESPLGWIPQEWDVEELGQILNRHGGYLQTGPFGSQLHASEYQSEGVPVVMPQDINDGRISRANIVRISEDRANDLSRHRMRLGDIVIARRGELSRAAAVSEREKGWLCGTGCFLLRLGNSELRTEFASYVYRQDFVQRQIAGRAVGTTMPSLNNSVMSQLAFPFCQSKEQLLIVERLNAVEHQRSTLASELGSARKVKSGLMHDLLTGRVRVATETSAKPAPATANV